MTSIDHDNVDNDDDDDDGEGKIMWKSPEELSPEWVAARCGIECTSAHVTDISNATAPRSCFRVAVTNTTNATTRMLVLKQLSSRREDGVATTRHRTLSKHLGLAREAIFYAQLGPALARDGVVPQVFYAKGNMTTGLKRVMMEDLGSTHVDSGVFFGPGNPNNWGRDLPALCRRGGDPPVSLVVSVTFKAMARLHARHWCDESLLSLPWLRGAAWVGGGGAETWEAAQAVARDRWVKAKAGKSEMLGGWDAEVVAAVDAAVAGLSWEKQRARMHRGSRNWCLVQGDCWPGNVMWDGAEKAVKLIDWEMVGVGSGPQELGQYMISNAKPAARRECERGAVAEYHAELCRLGVRDVTMEQCWREYVVGGVERWLWFLCYFAGEGEGTAAVATFFHNQVAAFMHDHGVTAKDVTQLRC